MTAHRKWFSVLPIEKKSDWNRFTQESSKRFDSERNKQHQRVLCKEIRRLPNETVKKLAVRIETLVQKAYSLNTHDYKNTKMTEILMMTLIPKLRNIAIKKKSITSFLNPRKIVDKHEQAEITMKLEETEILKLQDVNNIQTTTTQVNNIHDSDKKLSEKIREIINIGEKNPNFNDKPSFKKWCNYCRRYGHSIAKCRQKQNKIIKINLKNIENPINHFISIRKKIKIYPTRIFIVITSHKNHLQAIQTTLDNNHLVIKIIEDNHQIKKNPEISHKTDIIDQTVEIVSIEITIQDQIQTDLIFRWIPVPIHILGLDIFQIIDLETLCVIETAIIPTIGMETIQMIEIDIKIFIHVIILTTDQTIKDQITIKRDHAIVHRIEAQVITTDKETTPNHHIGITHIIRIHNKIIEVVHLNIKDK